MIPNQWYPLLEARKLRRKPVGVTRMGEAFVLWRDGAGRAVCMRDRCPHRGVALSRGKVADGQWTSDGSVVAFIARRNGQQDQFIPLKEAQPGTGQDGAVVWS